jgi:hypothetical protein
MLLEFQSIQIILHVPPGTIRNAYRILYGKPRPVAGSCEHGNEPAGYIRGGEFLDRLIDRQLFKVVCTPN